MKLPNLDYKVNYRGDWDNNGTYYKQTIIINKSNVNIIDALNDDITCTLLLTEDTYIRDHLRNIKQEDNGIYYLTITQLQRLKTKYPFKDDTRIKTNRNTRLIIK